MQRKTLALFVATAMMLSGTAFVVTAEPAGDQPLPSARADANEGGQRGQAHRGGGRGGMEIDPAARAAIMDLRAIDRLYGRSGRTKELPAFYRDVLTKTRNPMLRNFIYMRLARLETAPANTDQAIATLRQSLDENLKRADAGTVQGG
jgi:hypothetical protein